MRTTALRLAGALVLACFAPVQAAPDDHAGAVAALADVRAAVWRGLPSGRPLRVAG